MSISDTQIVSRTEPTALAKEIAQEVVRQIDYAQLQKQAPDPKGLLYVRPALLNLDQAAKYMGRTAKGVRDLMSKGILVPVRFDRKIQFRVHDLDEAIERYRC
jgi:hypothetical protein